jgi:hypothetical protein
MIEKTNPQVDATSNDIGDWHTIAKEYKDWHPALHPHVEQQLAARGLLPQSVTPSMESDDVGQTSNEAFSLHEYKIDHDILEQLGLPALPNGYGFIGGAARAIAQKLLFDESAPIRDIDIVAISDYDPDLSLATELSAEYMPDDNAYGHGIREETKEQYFATRDLSINEILVVNNSIFMSDQAVYDLEHKVVRLTSNERELYGGVGPRMSIKMLLLEQVFLHYYDEGSVAQEEFDAIERVKPFDIALGLNKALQYGSEIARGFTSRLEELGMLPNDDTAPDPAELGITLAGMTDFVFRNFSYAKLMNSGQDINPLNDLLDKYSEFDDYEDEKFSRDVATRRKTRS